jgi:hypothetical protein
MRRIPVSVHDDTLFYEWACNIVFFLDKTTSLSRRSERGGNHQLYLAHP